MCLWRIVLTVLVFAAMRASSTIDVALQMQLGNPSNATADTNSPDHYLIQRPGCHESETEEQIVRSESEFQRNSAALSGQIDMALLNRNTDGCVLNPVNLHSCSNQSWFSHGLRSTPKPVGRYGVSTPPMDSKIQPGTYLSAGRNQGCGDH